MSVWCWNMPIYFGMGKSDISVKLKLNEHKCKRKRLCKKTKTTSQFVMAFPECFFCTVGAPQVITEG
jgi:hypothetical protein